METRKNQHVEWIDAEKPNPKELAALKERFRLHPVILNELKGPSARARVDSYGGYLFFVYYFPKYDASEAASVRTEIDFIVNKDTVATVHYEPVSEALQSFKLGHEKDSLELMYKLVEHLITFEERQLRHVREKVEAVGRAIFKDKEREVLEQLTYLKRDISEYRIVVRLQEPIFHSLLVKGRKFWGEKADIYLNDLVGDHLKVVSQLEDYREAVADFEDTNNQLMNLKINSVMQTFTTLSFLTFPFVLVATLFSMNAKDIPLENTPGGFWLILGGMAVCMLLLLMYFRKRKWF